MGDFDKAAAFLPEHLRQSLQRVPYRQQSRVQEIRLRRDGFLSLSLPEGERTVNAAGVLSDRPDRFAVRCTGADVENAFLRLCDYSVHSHAAELCAGFVTAPGGLRAGVAGTAVQENGRVTAVRDIRSLCIRVAGRHDGCADPLRELFAAETVPSLLLAGEPAAGKTSLLRDIGRQLANGGFGRRLRVAVVDERGELSGAGGLENCDVLTGCPKPQGILQAVRTLAPDVILLDELGTPEEVEAVTANLHAGVPAIATAHARDIQECLRRPAVRLALHRQVFDRIIFLSGRAAPGRIRKIAEVNALEAVGGNRNDRCGGAAGMAGGRSAALSATGVGGGAAMAYRF